MHIPKQQRTKLQPKSKKYIFVGYDGDSNNYRLFDPETRKIKISRDVIFNEDFDNSKPRENIVGIKLNNEEDTIREHLVEEEEHQDVEDNLENDFHQVEEIHEEETQTRKLRPRQNLKQPDRYCANLVEIDEPETYEEAVKSPQAKEWISAINEELTALKNNNTWELQELPIDKKAIGFKWVFKIKRDTKGNINRYKARLCAKGFSQIAGSDYFETFSPTIRYDTIRVLLAEAVQKNYNIMQFDVKTAFLNGDLDEEVYMLPPTGIVVEENQVCKLKKISLWSQTSFSMLEQEVRYFLKILWTEILFS